MFIPSYYKNENIEEVKDFLVKNSFGILVNLVDGRPWGTHIPLELTTDAEGNEVLYGHIAKANPQSKNIKDGDEILAIFPGPHSYVSSSWYTFEEVPTWNYIAVHVYGRVAILDEKELLFALDHLTNKYEALSEHPVSLKNLSEKTMKQVRGIVGFKIFIKDIQAAYKLSQNRKDEDYHNIINHLETSTDPQSNAIAGEMKSRRENH